MSDETVHDLLSQIRTLRLSVLGATVSAVAIAAGAWVQTRSDIAILQRDLESVQRRTQSSEEWREDVNAKLERIAAQNEYMIRTLGEMKGR